MISVFWSSKWTSEETCTTQRRGEAATIRLPFCLVLILDDEKKKLV